MRIRKELEAVVAPLQIEFQNRQGAFRAFPSEDGPVEMIQRYVAEAAVDARKDLRRHLKQALPRLSVGNDPGGHPSRRSIRRRSQGRLAQRAHAAVRRAGGHCLVKADPHATSKRNGGHGTGLRSPSGEHRRRLLVEWSRRERTRVQPAVVEALHQDLVSAAKELASVGKEATCEELRARVKTPALRQGRREGP